MPPVAVDNMPTKNALKTTKKKIAERLVEIRGDRSQRQFAADLGVFPQNINRYERGSVPHPDFLITLALNEGVSLDWLLFGEGKKKIGRSSEAPGAVRNTKPPPRSK